MLRRTIKRGTRQGQQFWDAPHFPTAQPPSIFSPSQPALIPKEYLWAFHDREGGLVWYVYENGSRSREVVEKILADFTGTFTSDGYAAYRALGDPELHPGMLHCGCWTHVRRNFIHDGRAEISNNLCEQRMKPIKLDLKTCQNIGSESAAENAAFMHSLVESCRLHDSNPYDYLLSLFKKLGDGLDNIAKRALLPDKWVPEC